MKLQTAVIASLLLLTVAFAQRTGTDAQQKLQPKVDPGKHLELELQQIYGNMDDLTMFTTFGSPNMNEEELVVMDRDFKDLLVSTMDRESMERDHAEN